MGLLVKGHLVEQWKSADSCIMGRGGHAWSLVLRMSGKVQSIRKSSFRLLTCIQKANFFKKGKKRKEEKMTLFELELR